MSTLDLLAAVTLASLAVWCVNHLRPLTLVLLLAAVFWLALGVWAFS